MATTTRLLAHYALQSNTDGDRQHGYWSGALVNATGIKTQPWAWGRLRSRRAERHLYRLRCAGENVSQSCYIGNIFHATSSSGSAVFVNSTGKLGTITSSRRFKEKIKPMDQVSKALFALKPVSFRYKEEIDPAGTSQLGLSGRGCGKGESDLVVRDKEGKPYSVRYDQVNAMLLNEFLKEHGKVELQQAAITQLESAVAQQRTDFQADACAAYYASGRAGSTIQKVSAQLELNKSAPQTVLNER